MITFTVDASKNIIDKAIDSSVQYFGFEAKLICVSDNCLVEIDSHDEEDWDEVIGYIHGFVAGVQSITWNDI